MSKEQQIELQERLEERGLEFRRPDAWEQIQDHVGTHQHLLDLRSRHEVAWRDAEISWERSVMNPLLDALERQQAARAFPGRTMGDLYIEISDHWYYLKQERQSVSPDEAVESFTERFGERAARWLSLRLLKRIANAVRTDWSKAGRIERNVRNAREHVADASLYY